LGSFSLFFGLLFLCSLRFHYFSVSWPVERCRQHWQMSLLGSGNRLPERQVHATLPLINRTRTWCLYYLLILPALCLQSALGLKTLNSCFTNTLVHSFPSTGNPAYSLHHTSRTHYLLSTLFPDPFTTNLFYQIIPIVRLTPQKAVHDNHNLPHQVPQTPPRMDKHLQQNPHQMDHSQPIRAVVQGHCAGDDL